MLKNKQMLMIYLFLTIAPLLVFWQVNNCDFTNYDDIAYVTKNNQIQSGITMEGIRWAFTTGYTSNWHPLTWISHMLDVQFFGLQPRWHHLSNLFFHIVNTLLLFFVLYRMTNAPWKSAFVAALFALHPLHVESVAWVAERKDVLSTAFWMLTMAAYCYYVERPGILRYLVIVIFFVLGLMAKPMIVTLPFVLLLLDYWPLQRFQQNISDQKNRTSDDNPVSEKNHPRGEEANEEQPTVFKYQWTFIRPLLWEKIPLFILAALSSIVTYIVQQKGNTVATFEALSPSVRIANAFVSYITYIEKMVWPSDLAVLYPHPRLFSTWQVVGAAFLLIAITVAAIVKARKNPYFVVGWLWYVGTLVPVIGIVQVGIQARADRYTYLPLIGLCIMTVWGISELSKNWRHRKEVLFASSTLILLCLCIVTWTQVGYWKNSIALFGHALNVTDDNYIAYNNRGLAYWDLGNGKQAIGDYDKAIEINPKYAEAHNNRGLVFASLGSERQAIEDYDKAIQIKPKFAEAYYNRGISYWHIGDGKQAIEDFDKAIQINLKYAKAHINRGVVFAALGNERQAIEDYNKAIQINPNVAEAYYNRGYAYWRLGNEKEAIENLRTAARLGYGNAQYALKSQGIKW